MQSIRKLDESAGAVLFQRSPQLNNIWELPALQADARASYEGWSSAMPGSGEIFSIEVEHEVIGVLGWFEYGKIRDVLRLRYYGIVPPWRGKGCGLQALKQLLAHLSTAAPPQYVWLSESVTLAREGAPATIRHFKRLGFVEFDDPDYGDNANCGPTLSLKVRIPGR